MIRSKYLNVICRATIVLFVLTLFEPVVRFLPSVNANEGGVVAAGQATRDLFTIFSMRGGKPAVYQADYGHWVTGTSGKPVFAVRVNGQLQAYTEAQFKQMVVKGPVKGSFPKEAIAKARASEGLKPLPREYDPLNRAEKSARIKGQMAKDKTDAFKKIQENRAKIEPGKSSYNTKAGVADAAAKGRLVRRVYKNGSERFFIRDSNGNLNQVSKSNVPAKTQQALKNPKPTKPANKPQKTRIDNKKAGYKPASKKPTQKIRIDNKKAGYKPAPKRPTLNSGVRRNLRMNMSKGGFVKEGGKFYRVYSDGSRGGQVKPGSINKNLQKTLDYKAQKFNAKYKALTAKPKPVVKAAPKPALNSGVRRNLRIQMSKGGYVKEGGKFYRVYSDGSRG
ncbi:hypothetical protein ACFL35_14540, partial [Candidatus Riflebacteria bacterium]